jgi:hypothetical protein
MISKEIKKTVTKVTKLHSLIINELRVTFVVTIFEKVTKVTKVTQKLHAKTLCLSGFEGYL